MGVVNVTPDSFFPASRTSLHDDAVTRGLAHFRDEPATRAEALAFIHQRRSTWR